MNLIAGATGMLGSEICRLLREQGKPVRALVRSTSNPETLTRLRNSGAEIVQGDLKDPASLEAACRGATAVISTASSTISRQSGDSIDSVDRQGQLNLIEAAEKAGVKQFILVSFPRIDISFPLQSAKRAAEERLQRSRMTYTILQPTCFMEVWLGPALGFDPAHGTAQIYGAGRNKVSWISFQDVAQFAVAALGNDRASKTVIKLGGPDALSPLEVVQIAERLTGKTVTVQQVPEDALRAQLGAATDPLQQSFAALMLYYALGDAVDMKTALQVLPVSHLKSVRDYLPALAS
jgi:NADH dehydrogenase